MNLAELKSEFQGKDPHYGGHCKALPTKWEAMDYWWTNSGKEHYPTCKERGPKTLQ